MFKVSENKLITMTRGDSGHITVSLNINTAIDEQLYELKDGDAVYLGITEPNEPFDKALIRKTIEGSEHIGESSITFYINSIDTEYLLPGTYFYSIKVYEPLDTDSNNYHVHTIIDKRKFTIID